MSWIKIRSVTPTIFFPLFQMTIDDIIYFRNSDCVESYQVKKYT
ncbi:hypothetical protein MtrunA17_Chr2g0294071 [Medicago truncatula]|uniref:Uncharacterized protein n=1 Tax=Medicago truncatula TaxID=3880 RepID=A0A396JCZ3_MEDTR|nr:hypothetical protein MtrunA17_Chr2g0294071 [Medicago truncatula]